jgi:hypothetical protein
MTTKKGSSNLPSGPVDLGAASSYGMDTLTPLLERNEGPLDHARLPEAKGISRLPEGILVDPEVSATELPQGVNDAEHIVLGSLDLELIGEEHPRLTDLSWLEDAYQDPNRLPHSTNNTVIPELVEEWGVGRRTDGVHFYNDKVTAPVKASLPVLSVQDLARSAIRVIASGGDASEQLKGLPENVRKAVASDIGLNGKVYIRAEAYPKCDTGKWAPSIQKTASSAQYIIQKSACAGCVRNNQGTCGVFQKRLVDQIPWDSAYKKYSSRLKTAGYTLPEATNNPKETLKKAFISGPTSKKIETFFQIQETPEISTEEAFGKLASLQKEANLISKIAVEYGNRRKQLQQKLEKWVDGRYITLSQMKNLLSSKADPTSIMRVASHLADANMVQSGKYTNPEGIRAPTPLTHSEAWNMLKEAEVQTIADNKQLKDRLVNQTRNYVTKFAKSGLISQKEAQDILKTASIKDAVHKLNTFVSVKLSSKTAFNGKKIKNADYSGVGIQSKQPEVSLDQARKLVMAKASQEQVRDDKVKLYIHTKQASAAHTYLNQLKNAGVISDSDIKTLDLNSSPQVLLEKIATIVNNNNLKKKSFGSNSPSKMASYSGEGVDALFGSDYEEPGLEDAFESLQKSAKSSYVSPTEIKGVLKWASEQMHEGALGNELDSLLSTRFSEGVLKAASGLLSLEREKHEGLAGILYVDAAHYASPTGTTGCEKGALRHRASSIKNVLSMSRCGSCVFKNANSTCQKYNKKLVSKPPVENPQEYKEQMIKLANSSDQENTQALFSNNNVIEEFQLKKEADLDLNDVPEYRDLDGIVFGDFDLE